MSKETINDAIKKCFEVCGRLDFDYLRFLLYGNNLIYFGNGLNRSLVKRDNSEENKCGIGYCIKNISNFQTYQNICKNFPSIEIIASSSSDSIALIHDNFFILKNSFDNKHFYITENYNDELVPYLVKVDFSTINYFDGQRFSRRNIKPVFYEDIKDNYNDDLPVKEIKDFIKDEGSGLCLFYGCPGTGKTYFIRSLISDGTKQCVVCSAQNFESLMAKVEELENSILIVEDCEMLIKDRNSNVFSTGISDLLNVSDGLMGDELNIKIICTFNSDLRNIDKALLRKGRTKIKYEFKPLTEDKAEALRTKLNKHNGKSTLLCDIFNENSCGVSDNQVKHNKIGF